MPQRAENFAACKKKRLPRFREKVGDGLGWHNDLNRSKMKLNLQLLLLFLKGYLPGLPDLCWYKIPTREKIYQITTNYTKCRSNTTKDRKMDQVSIKYTNIFHCKTLQNVPKFGFLVWQP
jgi:hypothetical protein